MIQLNDKQIAEFLFRSYISVDGLWFMKLEEKCGFDTALEIDKAVWSILPKIQARALKSMCNLGNDINALIDCFEFKMDVEGYTFKTEKIENDHGYRITVTQCPWMDLLVKSKRENLAGKIGTAICTTDAVAWAAEFGDNVKFELQRQICQGSDHCILQFSQ